MRPLLTLIIIGALGYYGWKAWQKNPEFFTRFLPKQAPTEQAEPVAVASTAPSTPVVATTQPTPHPIPSFVSKIAVPPAADGEKAMSRPGEFLVVERASAETNDGVVAVVPGDTVKLLERKSDGTLKVTDGKVVFTLKESQVTRDVATAQEAERKDFERKYGLVR